MKHKVFSRAVSMFLVAAFSVVSSPAEMLASETVRGGVEYVSTFQSFESTLAPGITQSVCSGYGTDGKRINYYVAVADLSNEHVGVQASYKDAQCETPGLSKMTDQAAAMNKKHTDPADKENYIENYAVVAGVNGGAFDTTSGMPSGAHVMNGEFGFRKQKADGRPWFAIFNDGTALCGKNNEDWDQAVKDHDGVKEAIGGFQLVRENGQDIGYTSDSYLNDGRYSRCFVGVTAKNEVVFMVVDGSNAGGSAGANYKESLEIMDDAGCTYILCLDGGGSATYISRPAGSNDIQVTNRPSDGSERTVSNGLVMYTTTPPSDQFETAEVSAETYYVTPNSSVQLSAVGVSPAGTAAEIPEDAKWTATLGSVTDEGLFVSNGETGDAEISLMVGEKVVGSTTIHVVYPKTVAFARDEMTVPFGATVSLEAAAKYDLNDVTLKDDDLLFTVTDEEVGKISGNQFTAAEEGTQKTETTITVSVNGVSNVTDTLKVKLGKGSEVIFDFEDGTESADLENWEVRDYNQNNREEAGNKTDWIHSDISIVNRETGEVHDGDSALAFHYRMDEGIHSTEDWGGNSITWVSDPIEIEDATGLGFWLWIPEDCTQLALFVGTSLHDEEGNWSGRANKNFMLYNDDQVQAENDLRTDNWHYVNNQEYSGWHYIKMPITNEKVYIEDNTDKIGQEYNGSKFKDKANCFIKVYMVNIDSWQEEETDYLGDFTFYIDNVTVDYSDAVDDRDAPIFSKMTYAEEGMGEAQPLNGQTVTHNTIDFAGYVAEDMIDPNNASGLDVSSAVTYIDGVSVDCTYADELITVSNAVLTDGVHTIRMGMQDKEGNYSEIKRQITVNTGQAEPTVRVQPHDSSLEKKVQNDQVYWVDVEADAVETVQSIEMKLDLDSMNNWDWDVEAEKPDHIKTLYGFDCETFFETANDKAENILTLRFTRNGDYLSASGTQTIASLPIRVWDYVGSDSQDGAKHPNHKDAVEAWKCSSETPCIPALSVDVDTEKGVVTYLDDSSHTFSSADIHTLSVAYTYGRRMIEEDKNYYENHCFHTHETEEVEDKEPTCTEDGYTDRTWCETCNSPVDWGTTVPATGHTFTITEGTLKCSDCGQTYTGVWTDGRTYADGIPHADGWDEDDCYWKDGKKLTGIQLVEYYYYDFGEDGICKGKTKYSGLLYDESKSAWRYSKVGELFGGWVQLDDGWHYFDKDTKVAATGDRYWPTHDQITYHFDETGRTEGVWNTNSQGTRFWYGEWYYQARNPYQLFLAEINGKTYNFDADGYVTTGIHALYDNWSAMMRGEMNLYEFDNDGALVGEVEATGLVSNKRGGWYLVEEDGFVHGGAEKCVKYQDHVYFVQNSGKLKVNGYQEITAETGKDLLAPGSYYFGKDGTLFTGEKTDTTGTYYYENGQLFTGMKEGSNGSLYYYKNGQPAADIKNQLIKADNQIYFLKEGGRTAADETIAITAENSNDLLPADSYYFGADGRLFSGEKKDADGIPVFYQDGKPGNAIYNNELVRVDGDIYFVKWSGKVAVNELREITYYNSNGLLKDGSYYFGADGKLSKVTGVVWDEKTQLYYYCKDGKLGTGLYNSALAEINGSVYLVKWSGKVAANETREITEANSNGLLKPGSYDFGADGKLYQGEKTDEEGNSLYCENGQPFTGVKKNEADGLLYYYSEGKIGNAIYNNELVSADGAVYFVKWSGKVAVDELREITAYNNNKLLANGSYYFGEDGKLSDFTGIIWDEKTQLPYYCKDGKLGIGAYNSQLAKVGNDIYFIKWSGKVAANETREITDANSNKLLKPGFYEFGADGKLYQGEKTDEEGNSLYYENGQPFTGVKKNEADGLLYYYSEGKIGSALYNNELVSVNGDIYFVKWSGKVAVNELREITFYNNNNLLANGSYYFGADGKLSKATGVVKDTLTQLSYYCKDGKLGTGFYNSALAEINGSVYLVKWSGKVAANETREITSANSNKLLKPGSYEFGADGKLYQGEKTDEAGDLLYYENGQPFSGAKKEADGLLYYYENGKLAKGVYNNELVSANGEIYFVKWSGKVAVNELKEITVFNSNKLLANGSYYFGADGKLSKITGVVWDEIAHLPYYCKDGKLGTGAYNNQLAKIGDTIYFIKWSGKVAANETITVTAANSNNLLDFGTYYFGADGKLQLA